MSFLKCSNFILVVTAKNFLMFYNNFLPSSETINFTDFLDSDYGSRIMCENNLSIHIESGNLYYNGLNTGESFYDFALSQRDLTNK